MNFHFHVALSEHNIPVLQGTKTVYIIIIIYYYYLKFTEGQVGPTLTSCINTILACALAFEIPKSFISENDFFFYNYKYEIRYDV